MTETVGLSIDIGVCTYRRPQLAATLRSLAAMRVPDGARLRVIVADNEDTPAAKPLIEAITTEMPFEIRYVHSPASNISIARNACLDNAEGDFLAFIDDDCVASADWLEALVRVAGEMEADAVLGPVRAVYADAAPDWMRQGDFHSTNPVWVRGELKTGYTCNVLIRRNAPSVAGRRFDLALGRTGGEDTEFFTRMRLAGGIIAYADGALASEPVPMERAKFSWLAKRRFRTGQTHGRLLGHTGSNPTVREVALAASKAAYCGGAALVASFRPVPRNRYVLRAIMHAGVVSGLMGVREITLYGDDGHGHAA